MNKYDRITWIGKTGFWRGISWYFPIKNYKAYSIAKFIVSNSNSRILDAGCSSGDVLNFVHKRKRLRCYGIDISQTAINTGKARYPHLSLKVGNVECLPYPCDFFDYITCYDVLEHTSDPERVVAEFWRVLKKNGKLICQFETNDRFDREMIDADENNKTKDSWVSGEEMKSVYERQNFEIEKSFYGGQLLAHSKTWEIISFLYHIPFFSTVYAVTEMLIALLAGQRMRGTWLFCLCRKK